MPANSSFHAIDRFRSSDHPPQHIARPQGLAQVTWGVQQLTRVHAYGEARAVSPEALLPLVNTKSLPYGLDSSGKQRRQSVLIIGRGMALGAAARICASSSVLPSFSSLSSPFSWSSMVWMNSRSSLPPRSASHRSNSGSSIARQPARHLIHDDVPLVCEPDARDEAHPVSFVVGCGPIQQAEGTRRAGLLNSALKQPVRALEIGNPVRWGTQPFRQHGTGSGSVGVRPGDWIYKTESAQCRTADHHALCVCGARASRCVHVSFTLDTALILCQPRPFTHQKSRFLVWLQINPKRVHLDSQTRYNLTHPQIGKLCLDRF